MVARLQAHGDELRRLGVEAIYLFGSVARGEDTRASDVDIFFDHARGLGLEVMTIRDRLAEIIGGRVDITTRESLHPLLRPGIEAEARRVL